MIGTFLEALLDEFERNRVRRTPFRDRVAPAIGPLQRWNKDGTLRFYRYRPVIRDVIRQSFPGSGETRIRGYVREAVKENCLTAWVVHDSKAEQLDGLPTFDQVPELVYNSWDSPYATTPIA